MKIAKIATFYDHVTTLARQEGCGMDAALMRIRKLGITALEITADNAKGREAALAAELKAAGLSVSCYCAYFDFGRGPVSTTAGLDALQTAQTIGAPKMLLIPGFLEEGLGSAQDQTDSMIQNILPLAKAAEAAGIALVMEPFDNENAPYATIQGLSRFLDEVPGLCCCFDTGNFCYQGEDAVAGYEVFQGKIGHVHLKDRAQCPVQAGDEGKQTPQGQWLYPAPVGGGFLPMADLVKKLWTGGYQGHYVIEHFGAANQWAFLRASMAWLDNGPLG